MGTLSRDTTYMWQPMRELQAIEKADTMIALHQSTTSNNGKFLQDRGNCAWTSQTQKQLECRAWQRTSLCGWRRKLFRSICCGNNEGWRSRWTYTTWTVENLLPFYAKVTQQYCLQNHWMQNTVGDPRKGPSCSMRVHFHRQATTRQEKNHSLLIFIVYKYCNTPHAIVHNLILLYIYLLHTCDFQTAIAYEVHAYARLRFHTCIGREKSRGGGM